MILKEDEFEVLKPKDKQDQDDQNDQDKEDQDQDDNDDDGDNEDQDDDGDQDDNDQTNGNGNTGGKKGQKSEEDEDGSGEEDGDQESEEDEEEYDDDYEPGMFGEVEELKDLTKIKDVQDTIRKSLNSSYGSLPGAIQEYVKKFVLKPSVVNWKQMLAKFIDQISEKQKYVMGNKRFIHQDIYLYGNKSDVKLDTIVVGVDISGSITEKQAQVFTNELNSILSGVDYEKVIVLYCDTQVQEKYTETYKKGQKIKIKFISGGGTAFQPVFDWVKAKKIVPSVLIYFTDLYGPIPEKPQWKERVIWGCTISRKGDDFTNQKQSVKGFGEFVPIVIEEN